MDTLGKGIIHIPGVMEQDGARFHHTTQNGARFKMYELFISEIFHLIFLDCGWPWVAETMDNKYYCT